MPAGPQRTGHHGGEQEPARGISRLNLNLPEESREQLNRLAAKTQRSITELVRTGLGLVKMFYECQAAGQRIVITDQDGNAVKEIVIPL